MAQFVFLYRGGVRGRGAQESPAQMQERMQRWLKWFKEVTEKGHIKDRGLPLELGGKLVRGTCKSDVTDGPYPEKDLVMGFSLIEAKDIDEASQLLLNNPIVLEGGVVEVRAVMPLNP
jgi:hypothetical protein